MSPLSVVEFSLYMATFVSSSTLGGVISSGQSAGSGSDVCHFGA